jgi:hypothetical protein
MITIFAIAGTMSACGRYGSPVRAVPTVNVEPAVTADTADTADESPDAESRKAMRESSQEKTD